MARQDYALDGSRQFVFPFAVQDASDLRLQLFPGTVVPQEDYTVTGAGPASQGVTVTWPDAPTEPEITLAIIRETPPERVTDFPNNQAVSARALNAEFDNVYQVIVDFIDSVEERVDEIVDELVPAITNDLVPVAVDAYLDEELPGLVEALAQPFVDQAEEAVGNAAESATAASESASAASDSASAASDSASAASDNATAASESATAAGAAELSAQNSASAAAGSRDTALGAAAEAEDLVTQATSGFVGFQDGIGYDFGSITSPMTYFDRDWGLITDPVD